MTTALRLLQISDLHLGAEEPQALAALHALVHRLRPDVLLCTGDVTQRARPEEFARVAAVLQALPAPLRVLMPGNHDLPPMWQPWRRWNGGRGPWRTLMQALQEGPSAPDAGGVPSGPWQSPGPAGVLTLTLRPAGRAALGLCLVDTSRGWLQAGGAVSDRQRQQVGAALAEPGLDWRVIATHHPLHLGRLAPADDRARGAAAAWRCWDGAGADLLLSGHSHVSGLLAAVKLRDGRSGRMRQMLCASATSWRRRAGVPNSVMLLSLGMRPPSCEDAPPDRTGPGEASGGQWQPWIWRPGRTDYVPEPARPL